MANPLMNGKVVRDATSISIQARELVRDARRVISGTVLIGIMKNRRI